MHPIRCIQAVEVQDKIAAAHYKEDYQWVAEHQTHQSL